jgi:hypothetical protein
VKADGIGENGFTVSLAPGPQWVKIDLQTSGTIYAIVIFRYCGQPRWNSIFRAVIVQISDDKDFETGVTTVFNNDYDDDLGFGIGEDEPYEDGQHGHIIPVTNGVKGRYVRLWSNGGSMGKSNLYLEVEVHGVPVPQVSNPAPADKR